MPVLKQYQSTPAMREAIVLDLGDIGAQASRIRAAAETQASQILSNAQAKAESLAKTRGDEAEKLGYEDGLQKGLAEGREQGHAEALAQSAEQIRQLTAAWSQVIEEWEQQRKEMETEARQAVLDFALSAAEKLVHRVVEIDETVVIDQAAQALSLVMSGHDASIRVHPVDRPILQNALPDLLAELSRIEHIELVDDESITPGGCVVAFGQGQIDSRIEKQLHRLIDMILPAPEASQEPEAASVIEQAVEEAETSSVSMESIAEAELNPPVYEITEQGLVETGPAQSSDEPVQLDDVSLEDDIQDDTPEAEA